MTNVGKIKGLYFKYFKISILCFNTKGTLHCAHPYSPEVDIFVLFYIIRQSVGDIFYILVLCLFIRQIYDINQELSPTFVLFF